MGTLMMGYYLVSVTVLSSSISSYIRGKDNADENTSTSMQISIITTSLPVGALIGSLIYARILKIVGGENRLMVYSDLLMITCVLLQLISLDPYLITITRLIQGILIGISAIGVPTYLMSLSPTSISGRLGSFSQISITLVIAISYSMGYLIDQSDLQNPLNWRICVSLPILMCLIRIAVCFMFPMDSIETHIQRK